MMHSSLIGKIEKAKRYAQEPERVTVQTFRAHFRGDNDAHDVAFEEGAWHCTCNFFHGYGTCQHVMALQRMLGPISPEDRTVQLTPAAATASV